LIELTTIYNTLSFNDKLDQNELEKFFDCCDLSATPYEIQQGLDAVLQCKLSFFLSILLIYYLKIICRRKMIH
jgi:hypothetical protein